MALLEFLGVIARVTVEKMVLMMTRNYTELSRYHTLEDRFEYLVLRGFVGEKTFGYDRWMNQDFYTSRQWKQLRRHVIARDMACDLGIEGYDIHSRILIHHMNPMTTRDLINRNPDNLDPEFLITTTHRTHNAIHYGDRNLLPREFVERRPGDTKLW